MARAYVRNGRMDILAANELGRALYAQVLDTPRRPPNSARFCFLDPWTPAFFADWEKVADDYIDPVAAPSHESRLSASSVRFTPGACTAWHTHPHGQTIWVTDGVGLCQRRRGPIEVIRPGDRIFFEPGEDHWHGATANRFTTHVAVFEVDDQGTAASWGDHVTDDEYGQVPSIEA